MIHPSEAQKKREKHPAISSVMARIGAWFGRRPTTQWSVYEFNALEELGEISGEDLALLEYYYTSFQVVNGFDPRRRDLCTLLNNWNGELDRARVWKRNTVPTDQSTHSKLSMFDLHKRLELLGTETERTAELLRNNTALITTLQRNICISKDKETQELLNNQLQQKEKEHDSLYKTWQELCAKRRMVKSKIIELSGRF